MMVRKRRRPPLFGEPVDAIWADRFLCAPPENLEELGVELPKERSPEEEEEDSSCS